jgi:hypothetical protein
MNTARLVIGYIATFLFLVGAAWVVAHTAGTDWSILVAAVVLAATFWLIRRSA